MIPRPGQRIYGLTGARRFGGPRNGLHGATDIPEKTEIEAVHEVRDAQETITDATAAPERAVAPLAFRDGLRRLGHGTDASDSCRLLVSR
ncbi:hypothetical protein THIOKS11060033 [Thiocapsa sp. KS1]|nr:hypothetical protein THIOKS11060033 [Thiocapsa sp. KS1]